MAAPRREMCQEECATGGMCERTVAEGMLLMGIAASCSHLAIA